MVLPLDLTVSMFFVFQSATEPSSGLIECRNEQDEDADGEEEEETMPAKLWRFFTT